MEERLNKTLKELFDKTIQTATDGEVFEALMIETNKEMEGRPRNKGEKKVYYISAEFLIGKLLSNNLINLGLFSEVKAALEKNGKSIEAIEEYEYEPSLGNGGLGRLAACFLDSIASLGLPGDGIGLNYHMGLFEQKFTDLKQHAVKNPWITPQSWLNKREISFAVPFRRHTVHSTLYDIDVPGYGKEGVNRLHLFDLDSVDDALVGDEDIDFDKEDVEKNL
ncbi:MAG: glycogen/starch/alpha-glucan phosphorylase, partial [Lachnospiraceae bacterium]|nr:glycogen/starch/alpha-glucan phosphorylase [Lachnospiraceae bacterium]